ncbi:MAG: hypothetical protein JRF63_03060 [Deltaproteobacteria bacterium]|nr:hypothetical protein [Deltaproteobacteria bacterium]
MFKLIKLLLVVVGLAGLAYLTFFVPLGDYTLYQHLVGISETEEAQVLGDEISKKAEDLKSDVAEKVPAVIDDQAKQPAAANDPLSEITDEDRAALSELLKKKNK